MQPIRFLLRKCRPLLLARKSSDDISSERRETSSTKYFVVSQLPGFYTRPHYYVSSLANAQWMTFTAYNDDTSQLEIPDLLRS